jgi:hypothetical protein
MGMTFEQPKHLSRVSYRRLIRACQPLLIFYGVVMSGSVLIALWKRAATGQQIAILHWMVGATIGLWGAGLMRLALRLEMSRRRYIEFRDGRLVLARCGVFALRRFVSWSLSPDEFEPRHTRLRLTYKVGFGRKHWIMLLDDDEQIEELRQALSLQIPQKDAA